jgi:hypothetical protein
MPNENGTNRLDRTKHALELLPDDHVQFREEHKQLLTAQVILTGNMADLAHAQSTLTLTVEEIGEKRNGLIQVVDGVIRTRPPAPPV